MKKINFSILFFLVFFVVSCNYKTSDSANDSNLYRDTKQQDKDFDTQTDVEIIDNDFFHKDSDDENIDSQDSYPEDIDKLNDFDVKSDDNESNDSDTNITNNNSITIFFDGSLRQQLVLELSKAKKSVKFVTYNFSDSAVMNELNNLFDKKIQVNGVVGGKMTQHPKFTVKTNFSGEGILHSKYFLIDDKTIIILSSNLAFNNIKNFMVIFKTIPGKSDYSKLNQYLSEEFDEFFALKRASQKKAICQNGCNISIGKLYFSPGNGCDTLSKEIENSKSSENYLSMYTITTGSTLDDSLLKLLSQKRNLHGILDKTFKDKNGTPVNQTVLDELNDNGSDISFYSGSYVWHHKFFVNDDFIEFGSMNWTYSGCKKNDEVWIISSNPTLKNAFKKYMISNLK